MGHLGNGTCVDGLGPRRTSRKSCERASRRLRSLIAKANRWGLTTEEVVQLPATSRLLSSSRVVASTTATWTTSVMMALILGGGIVLLVYICAPCLTRRTSVQTWRTSNNWKTVPGGEAHMGILERFV